MTDTFSDLINSPSLVEALIKEGITHPTEVQKRAIPPALGNKDLIVRSETGTGKTLAYLLPIFMKINAESRDMQAIILVPTHELAIQVQRQLERLSANSEIKAKGVVIIGNVNIERQIDKLREKPHILVGSAGRMLELIKKRKISAHTVKTIILDEADRLLDENNIENVKAVIKSTLKDRQLMAFSATMSGKAIDKAREIMKEPEFVSTAENASVPGNIEHMYFFAERRDKIVVLRKLAGILKPHKAMVFAGKSDDIDVITSKLQYHKLKAGAIHGSNTKADRKHSMDTFREGALQLLIASDIAARGLHIEGITHIFNLDMPEDPQDYLHRAGRTGRNGEAGVVVSIITGNEQPLISRYEKQLKINIAPRYMYEGRIFDRI